MVGGALYGASAVQLWLAAWCNNVCATTAGAATVGVTSAMKGASNRAWLSAGAGVELSCRATHNQMYGE